MERKLNIQKIEEFFFESMRNGWAADSKKWTIPTLPRSEGIPYRRGEYSSLDYYFTAAGSNKSFGSTVIWVHEAPVWVMHYGGWYNDNAIPFLKRALMRNYNDNIFLGGRGQRSLEGEDHTIQYINRAEINDFKKFKGSEYIISTSHHSGAPAGEKFGEYDYFGGLI